MARRQYLVTYDVSDDKRRTALFKMLEGNGDHVQFSVFFCALSEQELAALKGAIGELVQHDQDQVLILDVGAGQAALETALLCIGRPYEPPCRVQVV
jgi:CRISPR-associated protein Cas2